MKTAIGIATTIVLVTVAVGMVPFLAGCQSPGTKTASADTGVCPMCSGETSTTDVADMKYGKNVCPGCKEVSTIDPNAPSSMQDYIDPLERTVHVCEDCETMVSKCPGCRGG